MASDLAQLYDECNKFTENVNESQEKLDDRKTRLTQLDDECKKLAGERKKLVEDVKKFEAELGDQKTRRKEVIGRIVEQEKQVQILLPISISMLRKILLTPFAGVAGGCWV